MGRYIGWNDVVARYPSVSGVGGASEIGSSYIGYVENQIDGMLAPYFTVPFSNNNETVKDLCIELVYARIGNLKLEEAEQQRKMVMERIERLGAGKEFMLTTSGDTIATIGDTVYSNTLDYHPVFGVSPVEYQEVDSSQVYDEEVDRGHI